MINDSLLRFPPGLDLAVLSLWFTLVTFPYSIMYCMLCQSIFSPLHEEIKWKQSRSPMFQLACPLFRTVAHHCLVTSCLLFKRTVDHVSVRVCLVSCPAVDSLCYKHSSPSLPLFATLTVLTSFSGILNHLVRKLFSTRIQNLTMFIKSIQAVTKRRAWSSKAFMHSCL